MRKLAFALLLTPILLAGPAMADDMLATCKANPVTGVTADSNDNFCACIDKGSTGNDAVRADFMNAFKFKEIAQRRAATTDATKAVAKKCSALLQKQPH